MWNSPNRQNKRGKRYSIEDIRVLINPLDMLLGELESVAVAEVVHEPLLASMAKEELVFAMYQVFQALLGELPIPEGGHPGFQEAIIAELLAQAHGQVVAEIEVYGDLFHARAAAWRSICRLLRAGDSGQVTLRLLKEAGLDWNDPAAYRSGALTPELWEILILDEGWLWSEFLWDDDWRVVLLSDPPEDQTEEATHCMGLDMELVHRLPRTPSEAEFRMADAFLRSLIREDEALFESHFD